MVMKYLDPKADLTFKKIFGNHPKRLISLLNTLQSLNEDELIQQQQYLPTTEELEISGFTDAELRAYDKFWDSVSVERTLLDDRYQKGMEEGMEKGRAEGIEEGRAEGMEKGRTEGIEEGMSQRSLEIARKMLAHGMDETSIMDMTGLTAEEIKLLKAEM
jgi:flagellar biosynthesis/type III secretory pathway protein FliH